MVTADGGETAAVQLNVAPTVASTEVPVAGNKPVGQAGGAELTQILKVSPVTVPTPAWYTLTKYVLPITVVATIDSKAPGPVTSVQETLVLVPQVPGAVPPLNNSKAASKLPVPCTLILVEVAIAVNLYQRSSSGVPHDVAAGSVEAVAPAVFAVTEFCPVVQLVLFMFVRAIAPVQSSLSGKEKITIPNSPEIPQSGLSIVTVGALV